jgi:exonuclease VII small subunit
LIRLLLLFCIPATLLTADLETIRSEPKLEKRSELALEYGDKALDAARSAYKNGDMAAMTTALKEVGQSVELALQSLKDTGKHPSKSTKHYKRGEIKTRQLRRRLESFEQEVDFDHRGVVNSVERRVQAVHEEFLDGVMSRKKKS